ncbi:hypothetical protein [uncultured Rhodoblastus sp.]|uniref:hypothetical protein n=1 Tax=uncultured Rhodoblastus sp. TaxID=543037 RepID=UPI0025E86553|nr:hypothetical protein [uncultured Rhodoblastus sp.]
MRRRHRETSGGEVAMMAVITKAMGAFLVLMIMLLPYYTGDTQSQQTVDDTGRRIDEAKAGLDGAVDRLKKGRLTDAEIDDILNRLQQAHDELTEAQGLIRQLRIKVDQAASQINRLEQQNAALLAQVTALQTQAAQLQAEIEKLKQEIARLRAIDTEALQARIRELEAEIARLKIAIAEVERLKSENAAQAAEIEKLKNENEVLRVLAAFPDIFLSSKCSDPYLIPDLAENPVGIKGFKSVEQFIPTIMPWRDVTLDTNSTKRIAGDSFNSWTTYVTLSFEEGQEYQYDFFIRTRMQNRKGAEIADRDYEDWEKGSAKDADGSVKSSRTHSYCHVNMFIRWRGNVTNVKSFTLGPVEPVVYAGRVKFLKNGTIELLPTDPSIQEAITAEVCNRYTSFCALARQHARLRKFNGNPWEYEEVDPSIFAGPPPKPKPRLDDPQPTQKREPDNPQSAPQPRPDGPPPPPPKPKL